MDITPAATALAIIELARKGRFADISEKFAAQLRPMVPPDALRAAWESELASHGPVTSVGTPVAEPAGPGFVMAKVPVTFERGALTVAVGLTGEQCAITGIQLLPIGAAQPTAPLGAAPVCRSGQVRRDRRHPR